MPERSHRLHAFAWLFLCAHLGAHVVEEAATGFLAVWNPVLAGWGQRTGLPFPQFVFGEWLAILIVVVLALTALTPRIASGAAWAGAASYIFATVMIANGVHHLLSPLYLGRFLPGQFTSPLLIASSVWLIVRTRAASRSNSAAEARAGGTRSNGRMRPLIETIMFFLAAPGTVAAWVPYALTRWELPAQTNDRLAATIAAVTLIGMGAAALIECFLRFALVGRGTPAPVAPTASLVVSGWYRYTRNPMYIAVLTVLLGQALLFASLVLLEYAATVWLMAHAFVVWYEEPTLRREFGDAYDRYRAHVPRWLPRLRPWTPPVPGHVQ